MEFLIEDYEESENSWEPYANEANAKALDVYARKVGLNI